MGPGLIRQTHGDNRLCGTGPITLKYSLEEYNLSYVILFFPIGLGLRFPFFPIVRIDWPGFPVHR